MDTIQMHPLQLEDGENTPKGGIIICRLHGIMPALLRALCGLLGFLEIQILAIAEKDHYDRVTLMVQLHKNLIV